MNLNTCLLFRKQMTVELCVRYVTHRLTINTMRTNYLTRSERKDNENNIGIGVLQFSKNIFLLK